MPKVSDGFLKTVASILAVLLILWSTLFVYVKGSEGCLVGYGDQQLIDLAIEYEITAGRRSIDNDAATDLIKYRSAEEFQDRNKRCCTISRSHFEETGVLDRAIGATEVSVDFWYKAKSQGPETFYRSYVVLNACGKVLASHGMSEKVGLIVE